MESSERSPLLKPSADLMTPTVNQALTMAMQEMGSGLLQNESIQTAVDKPHSSSDNLAFDKSGPLPPDNIGFGGKFIKTTTF